MISLKQLCTCYLKSDKPRVCSHVAAQRTKKGEPLFTDKQCLAKAAALKGFEIVETNVYNWYQRHVGDYPIPEGMKVGDLGKNALFILRMKEPQRTEYAKRHYNQLPYDIGVIADPNNEGCYTIIYDFYAGGHGVDQLLGAPVKDKKGEVQFLCPQLKQTYDMVCESIGAVEAGDSIEFLTLEQARIKYPQYFSNMPVENEEEKTWVSVANTEQRIGVS